MHNEAHEAGYNHGVYYPEVPVDPPLLDGGERRVVDAYAVCRRRWTASVVRMSRRRTLPLRVMERTLLEKYIQ